MIAWLTDTLVMTGTIMMLILLVREQVGRWFGPGAAYALWALPMIRLFLPPLVLPESFSLTRAAAAIPPHEMMTVGPATHSFVAEQIGKAALAAPPALTIPWMAIALTIWLTGAVVFLAMRVISYRLMRHQLLRDVRVIGRSGTIRIVESRAVQAPVAFGVIDRVVALPYGFLAEADSDASDFAITHELEHHAGNDLIANMVVQPLFALHWFNPIAWLAWRALRSDQEAACDARVMSGRSRRERERYGRLIASFAAGSRFALAAPMAGPLKGDKPIIHRLKALVRNDVPERHRLLGRSLFAASVIAVPLTASVTYAAVEETAKAPPAPVTEVPTVLPSSRNDTQADNRCASAACMEHAVPARHGALQHVRDVQGTTVETRKPDAVDHMLDRADAMSDSAEAQADRAEAQAEAAEARAEQAERDAERLSASAMRRAREVEARAPRVEESWSADRRIQTIRIVSGAYAGGARTVRKMVIDGTCPADRPGPSRESAGETRICSGAPDSARHVAVALRQARADVANAHLPAATRSEILAQFDQEIAEAQATSD
jgi:beta-lactamase regulating signal transducer with metallopeptidase domain